MNPFSSVQFSHSVVSNSLRPHGLQHARLLCPLPTPRAYSNSCPSSGWCHPTISSSVIPFSSCLQSFPASGSFWMSQFFSSGGQSIGVSASASVLPMNIWDLFPLGWTGWSPCSPRDSQGSSPTPQFKTTILLHSASFMIQLSHPYMTTGKTIALIRWTFVGKVMSLLFNMLSRLVIAFLPRSQGFYRESWRWGSHAGPWWASTCLGCPQVMHVYSGDKSRPKTPTHSWTSELMCLFVWKR